MYFAQIAQLTTRIKAAFYAQVNLHSVSNERLQTLLLQIEQEYDFRMFSLPSFAQWVASKRRREIQRIGWHLPASISGVWLATKETDFVFYETRTPALHQLHIQLHELAHILCNHQTVDLDLEMGMGREAVLQYLMGAFVTKSRQAPPIEQVMLRSAHDNTDEQEAELLSAFIQQRIAHKRFHASLAQPITFSTNALVLGVYQTMGWV